MSFPVNQESQLGHESQTEESHSRVSRKEPGSGVSRAPSMMSDWSKEEGPFMAKEKREQEIGHEPDTISSQDKQPDLSRIFEVLEDKMITFVKNELNRFKNILSPYYKGTFEVKADEERDAREGALKMVLHFLCMMEHRDLADKLNQNELNVICQNDLRRNLNDKYQNVFEGIAKHGSSVLLQKIYTDLYITEGGSGKVNEEHEVRRIESRSRKPAGLGKPIKCSDIFKPLLDQEKTIRSVLTKGVAGIGKTISVQKYILDWAEGNSNQGINFIFPLCFRELNVIRDKECSFMDLLHHFFPETKQLIIDRQMKYNVLFVLDGLDECRIQLNFQTNETLTDVKAVTSLDVLLTNIIKGNLLPSALIWITSRPAAASQIPPEYVDLVTEVQGFNDLQKEEYFRKRINSDSLASEIISHMKSSRSLHIMCHIPVFCWIAAMVLEMIYSSGKTEIPKTLTEMYTYFLLYQTKQRNIKFDNVHDLNTQWNQELILHLGKLAYEQLEKGNLIFYDEDLMDSGIDVKEAAVYSGMCTQIFREESGVFLGTVFCFVHLSVQEYLAALYALLMMEVEKKNIISTQHPPPTMTSMNTLQRSAVDKALAHKDGLFDLFLRFLLGLSQESNQAPLHGLIRRGQIGVMDKIRTFIPMRRIQMGNDETICYIKEKIREASSSERMINLFHCLSELNDHSLVEEIQSFLNAGTLSKARLSRDQWSALVFVLLTSDQNLDVFDLKKYVRSDEALLRLKPVVEESHTTLLSSCGITGEGYADLASAVKSNPSHLEELDLRGNDPGDFGVKLLTDLQQDPDCKLKRLRLSDCGVTGEGYAALAAALKSNPSHLEELDLRGNDPGDSGVKLLTDLLQDPQCKLQRLRVDSCGLTDQSCATLAYVLCKEPSRFRRLYLSDNHIGDVGVQLLCSGLENPECALETLSLSDCGLTGEGYAALASALKSNPSYLEELDLRGNDPGDSGVKLLTDILQDPDCKLTRLRLSGCGITEEGCAVLTSALTSNPSSQLIRLDLDYNELGDTGVKQISNLLKNSDFRLQMLCSGIKALITPDTVVSG
ncbi:NACHT, LRR and PYD domains-containing protein 12-like [Engraulis encrasicolus]|uniref:NACHT, LRR and PYD domains-containing protein 12-like n=1 Tax=Engraulis encrasicolus TaxID=184585 RepID=UPI002FD3E5E8